MITTRAPDGAKKSVKKVWGVRRRIRSKKKLSSYDSATGFFHLQVGCEMERLPVPKIHKYKYTNTNTQTQVGGEMERLPVPGLVRLGKEMKMKSTSSCGC